MKLDTVTTYFGQFGIVDAIRFLCAGLPQRVFDSYRISSYSQKGEDRLIGSILTGVDKGFYVDVGCNHPENFSNTFALYKRGWTGINIDANSELIKKHQELKKRDISICAVISDQEQEVVFTEFNDSLVSTIEADQINKWKGKRKIKEQRIVNTISLNKILEQYQVPRFFDLLTVDVEGHDFKVLSSINLNIYRPKLIVVEIHEFDLTDLNSNEIYQYLKDSSYKLIGYAESNGYFIDVLPRK